jgi:hypothetical protein
MIFIKTIIRLFIALFIFLTSVRAQDESWYDKLQYLQYAPRYFGPNAFPLPELRGGSLNSQWEVEVRGEYHAFEGDRTKNIFARIYIPIIDERAGIEISYIFYEYYNMTQELVEKRHAAGRSWHKGAHGDVIINSFYKLFKNNRWADLLLEASLKTASGNRLADARYTDAASYWFNLNISRYLYKNAASTAFLQLQGLAGFYCWMTNSLVHRQNDAFLYAGGLSGGFKNLTAHADLTGFYGYLDQGDRPLILRTKINYEYRKNILSFRYKHGIKDYLYDTFSVGYIRRF